MATIKDRMLKQWQDRVAEARNQAQKVHAETLAQIDKMARDEVAALNAFEFEVNACIQRQARTTMVSIDELRAFAWEVAAIAVDHMLSAAERNAIPTGEG